jgi:decaprenyl-phosphate phosphoribosyltransferase
LADALVAFVCFCLAAGGTYYINDARDVEADRLHPTKSQRPVASGVVPVPVAYVGGVLLVTAGILLGLTVNVNLAVTVGGYVLLTTAYSSVLKHVAVVDLVAVAAGFVLRAVAGAVATEVPISDWFFIVTSFGALFMISGKRAAEVQEMGDDASDHRAVLGAYSASYTAYLRAVTSGAVLVAYCLWAFEKADLATATSFPWYQLSILPFVMAVLRYALVLDQGKGSAPEEIVLGDRPLQLIGIAWAIVFAIGVYTA